jgi:hypothetical protein
VSDLWPSQQPGGRTTKAPKSKSYVRTDWVSGWAVILMVTMVAGGLALFVLWPMASTALDGIQQLADTLQRTVRHALI